ncbi:MAG TPA: single-stranded DNA-binding protein [Coriobacteriia bacterium]|jgi:single-strand DNA-binding protein
MSINRVMITGNLTRDPELRSTGSGMSVLKMRMAVNDRRKNSGTGEWEDVANYVDVTVFGARADGLSKYLNKGSKIAVEGKLRWHEWESPAGEKRSALEVVADDIEFLSARNGAGAGGYEAPAPSSGQQTDDLNGEEIPF